MAATAQRNSTRTIQHLRWYICGLLFFATTVNYIDRQVLGILKPVLERELGWRESDFGWVVFAFQGAYAVMQPVSGRFIDWLGVRAGYAWAVLVWSLASMSHALAGTPLQFSIARFGLGVGESANFPSAVKTIADWFPRRERALATGIFNSGTNTGAIIAPLLVPLAAAWYGWRSAFLVTGSLDILWIVVWLWFFRPPREHSRLSPEELALIESDHAAEPAERISYLRLLRTRGAWAIFITKFLTDPVWYFYLYWLPGYLNKTYHLDLTHLGPPLVGVYLAADAGAVCGGWLSSRLLKLGWTLNRARKAALLASALSVLPVTSLMFVEGNLWLVVALVGLACAAQQAWSSNVFTLASDLYPKAVVGSAVGLGGMGGALGGMLAAPALGYWLEFSHGKYGPLFFVAGTIYLVTLGVVHLLIPRLKPVQL